MEQYTSDHFLREKLWSTDDTGMFDYKGLRSLLEEFKSKIGVSSPAKVEQEAGLQIYDLSGLDDAQKQSFASDVMKPAMESLMATFYSLGLESHLDQMAMNDANGDQFMLAFRKIVNDKLLGPSLPMAESISAKPVDGPWKYEVHHVQHREDADEYATISDGKVTLFIEGGQDDGDEQRVVNMLNELKIELDYDHAAEFVASEYERMNKEASEFIRQIGLLIGAPNPSAYTVDDVREAIKHLGE